MIDSPHDAMSRTLVRLRAEIDDDLGGLSELQAVKARAATLDALLDDLDQQLERVRQAAVITLVGATGAGKSTLLNALVGSPIAREGVDRPTTDEPVIYAPQDADLGNLLEDLAGDRPEVVRYDQGVARGPWTEQILVDAPDVNSVAERHRAVVSDLAARSDVLVVVMHRQSVVEEASVSFLDPWARRRGLLFVLNRADELDGDAREELRAQLAALVRERWNAGEAPVVLVSAKAAQSQPDAYQWPELCAHLQRLVRDGALAGVRRHNALGTAQRIAETFDAFAPELEEDLDRLEEEAASGWQALVGRVAEEADQRLGLRFTDVRALLWSEAAKRWDGPGGWALRVGGLSSLGLGASALIARRNPWLAAGAAVGGMASEQARKVARRRRLAGLEGLLPTPSEFSAWHTESLHAARLRAGRISGSTEAFDLGDAQQAGEAIGAVVEDAWSDLVERDLPQAAERSRLRWFRWPLDLPVYLVAAYVVLRAAGALFGLDFGGFLGLAGDTEVVGMDYLVNVAIVVGVYLFLVRFVVRRLLAVHARLLMKGVRRRVRDELGRHAGGQIEETRSAAGRCRARLGRLRGLEEQWRRRLREA